MDTTLPNVTTKVMEDLTGGAIKWIDSLDTGTPFFLYFSSVAVHHYVFSIRDAGTSNAGAYGDFIHDIDYSVGQLLEALEHRGLDKNTVFLFIATMAGTFY